MFRRDREGRKAEGVDLYVRKKWIDCTELSLENSNEQVEILWVEIRGQANRGNLIASVYYRTPAQEDVDKAFFL